jgi:exonuclease SbcD
LRLYQSLLGPGRNITYIDRPRRPDDGGILELEGEAGERLLLACVPFITTGRAIDPFADGQHWTARYAEQVAKVEMLMAKGLEERFNASTDIALFAAHLNVAGARYAKSERAIHISEEYATRIENLPNVAYAAFGHIHKPQPLPGTVTGRYAGSPIQLDFGEEGESKSCVLVEARPGKPAQVREIQLTGGRTLNRIAGTLDEIGAQAGRLGRNFAHVTVHSPSAVDNLSEEVARLLPEAVICDVIPLYADRTMVVLREDDNLVEEASQSNPELFRGWLARRRLKAPAQLVAETFEAVLGAVEADEDPEFSEVRQLAQSVRAESNGRSEAGAPVDDVAGAEEMTEVSEAATGGEAERPRTKRGARRQRPSEQPPL